MWSCRWFLEVHNPSPHDATHVKQKLGANATSAALEFSMGKCRANCPCEAAPTDNTATPVAYMPSCPAKSLAPIHWKHLGWNVAQDPVKSTQSPDARFFSAIRKPSCNVTLPAATILRIIL